MRPLVSVVVPVYNVRDYVVACLDSLSSQSYENLEIIVVDDGATDGSGEICEKYVEKDKRVKVLHKKNGGLSSARNYGIRRAKGEYICLVDSDDYVKKDFVKEMVNGVLQDEADVAICGYNGIIPNLQVVTGEEATARLLVEQENIEIVAWNKIYRRTLFDDILYPEGKNYEDSLTTYKLLSKAYHVAYVPKSLYVYRERAESITKTDKKEEKLMAREQAAKEALEFLSSSLDLKQASEIAMLTAKLAWMDFAINKQVPKPYYDTARKWIIKNKEQLYNNKYLNKKLKLYIKMVVGFGGKPYMSFRKLRHE